MVERSRIVPSLPKREIEISDGWSVDLQLHVVPRGAGAVPLVELDGLEVSAVPVVISATMAEVDPPDKCDIMFAVARVADDDELLVVRTASPHSLIEQHFPARLSDLDGETSVLFRAEGESVAVRTPEEPADVGAAPAQVCHECRDRRPVVAYRLASVASPVGETHLVIGPKARDYLCQAAEVGGAINQECDVVAFGPRDTPGPTRVDLGRRVTSFFG
jgi:hypothetical protein